MNNQTQILTPFNDDYWRQNYTDRPNFKPDSPYEDYQLAYQIGHEGCDRYSGKSFDEAETELKGDYEAMSALRSGKGLDWDEVKDAVRDAWDQARTT
jgi:hypothetical protein